MLHFSNDAKISWNTAVQQTIWRNQNTWIHYCKILKRWTRVWHIGADGGAVARSDSPSPGCGIVQWELFSCWPAKVFPLDWEWWPLLHISVTSDVIRCTLQIFFSSFHSSTTPCWKILHCCLHCQITRGCVGGCFCYFLQISPSSPFTNCST